MPHLRLGLAERYDLLGVEVDEVLLASPVLDLWCQRPRVLHELPEGDLPGLPGPRQPQVALARQEPAVGLGAFGADRPGRHQVAPGEPLQKPDAVPGLLPGVLLL